MRPALGQQSRLLAVVDGPNGAAMYNRAGVVPARHRRFGVPMPTLDERVAYLEGRMEEHSASVGVVRNDITTLRGDVQDVRRQIEHLDQRLSARMDVLDAKTSRHFTWLVGIEVATLIAIVGALLRTANP